MLYNLKHVYCRVSLRTAFFDLSSLPLSKYHALNALSLPSNLDRASYAVSSESNLDRESHAVSFYRNLESLMQ